ncbi:hypothetical protein PO124_01505 [Bacillus licheniformis]|nr:hypothetical protein [Bacillus licheniformis]
MDAVFVIRMPLTNFKPLPKRNGAADQRSLKGNMKDIGPLLQLQSKGAEIEVIVRDDYGNETRQTAKASCISMKAEIKVKDAVFNGSVFSFTIDKFSTKLQKCTIYATLIDRLYLWA